MNSPSACDACGKKFKVFGIKKKCKHCTDIVCKACLATHLELKHAYVKRSPRDGRQRTSFESFNVTDDNQQGKPQMLPPFRSHNFEFEDRESDVLKDVDAMEAKSEEDDEDDDDDDDIEDAKVLGATPYRQSPAGEKKSYYRELQQIQGAVATWTIKEMRAKQEMKHTKETSYCRDMTEVYPKMRHDDEMPCRVVVVSYVVTLTLAVWTIFGLLLTVYLGPARINSSYALPGCSFFADT
ncbi:unnamed protein product [Hyaloperonospora brassicae]|uniref:FYVE zinc finger domain-containing protein n=1 Tax=Hyaloperonospora brassicae TaxID=162125 RepID=A0AAV0UYK4_HYABA|nr:unnamed protein product [Hyaloperonospora brassicae]